MFDHTPLVGSNSFDHTLLVGSNSLDHTPVGPGSPHNPLRRVEFIRPNTGIFLLDSLDF